MPAVATEYGCPTCRSAGVKGRIFATDGAITCSENSTHTWKDVQQFMDMKPTREYTVTPTKFVDSTPRSEMTLKVPTAVRTALETKFAGRLEATVIGFLTMLTEGEILAVPQSDLKLIAYHLGGVPQSSGELKGMIYSLAMDKEAAVEEAATASGKLLAMQGRNPDMVVVDLGDLRGVAEDQAKGRDMTLDQFCETSLKNGIQSSWF